MESKFGRLNRNTEEEKKRDDEYIAEAIPAFYSKKTMVCQSENLVVGLESSLPCYHT